MSENGFKTGSGNFLTFVFPSRNILTFFKRLLNGPSGEILFRQNGQGTAGYDKVMKCAIENSTYALPFSFIFLSALLQYLAHCKSLLSKVLTVRTS